MARPTRPREAPLYADSDSDGAENSEHEATPKPSRRSKGKKRISDVFVPDAALSSPGRVPLKSVNINDDEAEKRKRRKSTKIMRPILESDGLEAGPSSPAVSPNDTPRAARQAKQKQQLMSVAQTPVINVPMDVMSSNFEEWMKMATDNKINAANSWNFALIDYFHDMSLLRNNGDNSINFQKASCTLDGCVKIWTSRVDSVGTETGKLLSNLASEGRGEEEDENALDDNPDADPTQRKRAKAHRQESTLAKNIAQLRSKKLDLEFSVDPLFKKTCADFDEGGAQGLLMNHLSLGVGSEGSMRVIFDASDSMGKSKDEEEDVVEPADLVDLSYLRNEFLPDLGLLNDKAISHSLANFSFAKDAFNFDASMFMNDTHINDDDDDDDDSGGGRMQDVVPMDIDGTVGDGDVQDFFVGDQAVDDDLGGLEPRPDEYGGFDGEPAGGDDATGPATAGQGRPTAFEPFDPRRMPNERDLIMAMTDATADGGSLDYFDQTFLKNWAGPEHWKLRKVVRRPDASAEAAAPKAKREKKEPFKIDFLTPLEKSQKEIAKEIFAPVTRGGSINLPQASKTTGKKGKGRKVKEKEKRNDQTLPDDMHFSSRQLVTLFLKPKFALKMRGYRARLNDGDGEVDENFWAQAAADQAAGRREGEADETENGGAIPFNTQFFHDEYDDGPGFDDAYDGEVQSGGLGLPADLEPGEQDLLAATQGQSRRARPELVNYAKRAKRVDVRKLKENIWRGLDIVVSEPPADEGHEGDRTIESVDTRPPTDPEVPRVFTSVISGLQRSYPREKMEEISTSFCFICLLHLANERGLKLEVDGQDDDTMDVGEEQDKPVGDIWGLKVYRDPTATPSA